MSSGATSIPHLNKYFLSFNYYRHDRKQWVHRFLKSILVAILEKADPEVIFSHIDLLLGILFLMRMFRTQSCRR
jgi:hypothetical protein